MAESDSSLRRLVARLAQESDDDIAAVLDALSEPQRRMVVDLLAEHHGAETTSGQTSVATISPLSVSHLAGLSPWLASRVAHSAGVTHRSGQSWFALSKSSIAFDEGYDFEITSHALHALQDAAACVRQAIPVRAKSTSGNLSDTVWGRARAAIEGLWR